jgi:hypothetical protein
MNLLRQTSCHAVLMRAFVDGDKLRAANPESSFLGMVEETANHYALQQPFVCNRLHALCAS